MAVCALLIIIGLFTPYVYTLNCATNPCNLDPVGGDYSVANGYTCTDIVALNNVACRCPDGQVQIGSQCRICDLKPLADLCGPTADYCREFNFGPGQPYACLCGGLVPTAVIGAPCLDTSKCDNDGVRDPTTNLCNCPSGFIGSRCEIPIADLLCENIQCMSKGTCAKRLVVAGPKITYQSQCLCPIGSDGEYCEQPSMPGSCPPSYCLHGTCQQRAIGNSNYIHCRCEPGWAGTRCHTQYFFCQAPGYFVDGFMNNQGKYFSCLRSPTGFSLQQLSCPKGLKFDLAKQLCLR